MHTQIAQERFPGRDVDAYAAAALAGTSVPLALSHLGLFDEHLLDEPRLGRYCMHDLVAAYAAADPDADRMRTRLVEYYRVAAGAGAWLAHAPSERTPARTEWPSRWPRPA